MPQACGPPAVPQMGASLPLGNGAVAKVLPHSMGSLPSMVRCFLCIASMCSHPARPTACCLYAGKLSVIILFQQLCVAMCTELHIEHGVAAGAIPGDWQQRCAADVACSHAQDGVNAVVGAQCCPGATTATCSLCAVEVSLFRCCSVGQDDVQAGLTG